MNTIDEILASLREGRMIVLTDDEHRENEGDLVCAAQFVTPEIINFMLREARGMMCVALSGEICDRFRLHPQSTFNTSQRSTAYTVSVDAHDRFGVTTGVSAADRACTIRLLVGTDTSPDDFARPGHIQPLRARIGGCLVRAGQTEGSVDLCRLAGLQSGAVIIEVMKEDGTMARRDDLLEFCRRHDLRMCSVADVIHYRLQREKLVSRIDTIPLVNDIGEFTLITYRSHVDSLPHVALVCGEVGKLNEAGQQLELKDPVLVRMHSQNLLSDVFGDSNQPSGRILRQSMQMIRREGKGAIVYLRHEAVGAGLVKQLHTADFSGVDKQAPGYVQVGYGNASELQSIMDPYEYGIGSQILRDLGVKHLRLITNHPFTPNALSGFGLSISEFVSIA